MADAYLTVALSMAEAKARLRQVPGIMARGADAKRQMQEDLLTALGNEALACLHEAYLVKSRGGTDEAGISWPPRKNQRMAVGLGSRAVGKARTIPPARYLPLGERPIGVKTGRLVASFEPGNRSDDQILEISGNGVDVGSRVPYAEHFHRLRQIIPDSWPEPWAERIAEVMADWVVQTISDLVGERRPQAGLFG